MSQDAKAVDLDRARSKLDGAVILSFVLAAFVIPLVHKILHNVIFTVRTTWNLDTADVSGHGFSPRGRISRNRTWIIVV